ncbi:hypothetical protein PHYC_02266 [Phycisphaerales bacterium]|nr:hypothetical protein PHYC_02266 [Phycisphaerales bacterium]
MSERANVRSVKSLLDAKAALHEFSASAKAALSSAQTEIHRVTQWLHSDRPAYWKREIRRREDAVTQWKLEIQRKKLIAAPDPASTVFEQRKLTQANARVDSAKQRLAAVHRWQPIWEKEAANRLVMIRSLSEALAVDIPGAIAKLDRMVAALEGYAAIRAPQPDSALTSDPAPDSEPSTTPTPSDQPQSPGTPA